MTMNANKGSCVGEASCDIGSMVVKQLRYDDTLTIKTRVIGGFNCVKDADVSLLKYYFI